jgi:ArsR family transcriptional regulator, arsenate/arsenite/antimonite-responsive transcriptional repressor
MGQDPCEDSCGLEDVRPDDRSVEGVEADADLARLTKALGHPARVTILRVLCASGSCMYGDLTGELDLAKSTVSQHLKILKDVGLVRGTIDGPRACYCVERRELRRLHALIEGLTLTEPA